MSDPMPPDDLLFEALGEVEPGLPDQPAAPSRLKSRIFSRLNLLQAKESGLLSLAECKAQGDQLCIFEELLAIAPVGDGLKSRNPCRVCHARVLGENVEDPPIYWPGCPYVQFKKG